MTGLSIGALPGRQHQTPEQQQAASALWFNPETGRFEPRKPTNNYTMPATTSQSTGGSYGPALSALGGRAGYDMGSGGGMAGLDRGPTDVESRGEVARMSMLESGARAAQDQPDTSSLALQQLLKRLTGGGGGGGVNVSDPTGAAWAGARARVDANLGDSMAALARRMNARRIGGSGIEAKEMARLTGAANTDLTQFAGSQATDQANRELTAQQMALSAGNQNRSSDMSLLQMLLARARA